MTTTKSYSERSRFAAMYRASLRQQLPIGIVAAIIFAILIPLIYLVGFRDHTQVSGITSQADVIAYYANEFRSGIYLRGVQCGFVLLALMVLAMVCALIQTSYMHSKKMTDLYHSIPVRRPHLLTANLLASATIILVPFLAVYLLTFALQMIQYGTYLVGFVEYFRYIAIDLFCALVTVLVIMAFTTFVAVNVGTVFDSFAITGVLGITPLATCGIIVALWSSITYGAQVDFEHALWLSPLTFEFQRFNYMTSYAKPEALAAGTRLTAIMLLVWLVIGVVLYLAAIRCYKHRKSEIAEQAQDKGVFQTIVKCFAAFCGGAMFMAIFSSSSTNLAVWLIAMLFGAVLVGVVAELILSRGYRSLVKNLKWLVGAGALCCVLVLVFRADPIGYETRVPDAADVESVTVNYQGRFAYLSDDNYAYSTHRGYGSFLTDPASIAVVTEAHRMAVSDQPPDDDGFWEDTDPNYPYQWLNVNYRLRNGKTLSRYYYRLNKAAYLKLADLENKEDFIRDNHMVFTIVDIAEKLVDRPGNLVDTVTLYSGIGNSTSGNGTPFKLSADEAEQLMEAARKDMLAESLEDIHNPAAPPVGYMDIQFRYFDMEEGHVISTSTVIIGQNYTNTITALGALGMSDAIAATPTYDEIRLGSLDYHMGDRNQVVALRQQYQPNLSRNHIYGAESEIYVTDRATMEQIQGIARGQLLSEYDGTAQSDLVLVAYLKDGEQVGIQLARLADIPDPLRSRLTEAFNSEDSYTQYAQYTSYAGTTIAIEAVSAVVGDDIGGAAVTHLAGYYDSEIIDAISMTDLQELSMAVDIVSA